MDITPFIDHNINIITKYNNAGIYVNDQFIDHNVILSPQHIHRWQSADEINEDQRYKIIINNIKENLYGNIPIIIINTCSTTEILRKHIVNTFAKINILPEIMPNRSAYKTYNILASEGRNVVLALKMT